MRSLFRLFAAKRLFDMARGSSGASRGGRGRGGRPSGGMLSSLLGGSSGGRRPAQRRRF